MAGRQNAKGKNAGWPRSKIDAAIRRAFKTVAVIGEDASHTIYDVEDGELRFVIALVHEAGAEGVTEIGFLARFLRYPVTDKAIRDLNSGLHLSGAFIESGELYLVARFATAGPYDETRLGLVLEAWRRDMFFAIGKLSGRGAVKDAGGELGFDAGQIKSRPAAFIKAYFWRNNPKAPCRGCKGKGRTLILARECEACDGKGFVETSAPARA